MDKFDALRLKKIGRGLIGNFIITIIIVINAVCDVKFILCGYIQLARNVNIYEILILED